jgi:hypothetical protein
LLPRALPCSPAHHVWVLLERPSAQSPLARARGSLLRHGVTPHVSGRYPTFLALTDSCASPQPSRRLGGTLGQWVGAGCGQPLLGEGPSRGSLCASFPACLAPDPGSSRGACARFFPPDIGLPPVRTGSALGNSPCRDFRTGLSFGAAVIPYCSGPQGCSPPRSLLPLRSKRRAAVVSPSEPLVVCYLPTPRIC